jgi:hypothetical protein
MACKIYTSHCHYVVLTKYRIILNDMNTLPDFSKSSQNRLFTFFRHVTVVNTRERLVPMPTRARAL